MNTDICVIFGAGNEFPDKIELPEGNVVIIAADGGMKKLGELGITPDHAIGDLDSLDNAPYSVDFRKLPHIKDTTDMYEAVKIGLSLGCSEFHIYGGTGGRLDHTLANIQLAAELSAKGKKINIYGSGYVITAVTNGKITLPCRESGYVSVFAHSDICAGVTIKGLFYEIENAELRNTFALGVSNEFSGKKAEITVKRGTLCIYYEVQQ